MSKPLDPQILMGIIGKIISVAFIWYLVVLCVTASLVTIAKSGLVLSSLKMLISVLSNKAVLDSSCPLPSEEAEEASV